MNEKDHQIMRQEAGYDENVIDLLDLFIILAKRKKLIFFVTFVFAAASIVYSLFVTPVYRSTTRILPPGIAQQSRAMSMMSDIPDFAVNALGIKSPGDQIVGLVKSRTIMDRLIDRFDLIKRFESENIDRARNILSDKAIASSENNTGIISISVSDPDPEFAARLANAYVEELQVFMQELAVSDISQKRLFLEKQVKQAHVDLLKAENELTQYQKETGILNATSQASSLMSAIATFRARIAAKEVELETAQTFASYNNPKVQRLRAEIEGLKDQMNKLQAQASEGTEQTFNLNELPDAGMEYFRKLRDQKFYETLYGMLLKQFEQAKIAEAQEPSVIQVIDEAVPPMIRAKPNRKLIVVLSTILGLFLSIFVAFFSEFISSASNDPERKDKVKLLKQYLSLKSNI